MNINWNPYPARRQLYHRRTRPPRGRLGVHAKYVRWARQQRRIRGQHPLFEIICANMVADLVATEDARFFAMIDRMIASGRRLYYRMCPKGTHHA